MREKPAISDELIISRLQEEYNLTATSLTFLPIGADVGSVAYRVVSDNGTAYFLKLRKTFMEISVTVPLFLKSQGIQEIIAPFETKSKQGWADFGEYKMILYPFIDGKDGFEMVLSDRHKRTLGAALKKIHSAHPPLELKRHIPQETFSPTYRESMRSFQEQVEHQRFNEPIAAKLAKFIRSERETISHLIHRAEELALKLRSQHLEFVPCHTDIHGGNMFFSDKGEFYIVDWDNPLLAPKERDLMFIGGGVDWIWQSPHDEAEFYAGYGKTEIDLTILAYYRYERIIQDLVAYSEFLLSTEEGGTDREPAYTAFRSNFEPGQTIEIAHRTDLGIETKNFR
jgi:spectinomycin phosphotransferase